MFLKYVGMKSPIVIMEKNKLGGMGFSVKSGETFEVSPLLASQMLAKYNIPGKKPLFVEGKAPKPAKEKYESMPRKMVSEAPKTL